MTDNLVAIHVRFANDGSVAEISQRPAPLTPQEWFNALSEAVGPDVYRALAGGRGHFRLAQAEIDALVAKVSGAAAA
ncbi:hypothetical protein [Methylocystis bryophila]|uniref:Uncharacterized protein n=1 Tax=Methylocystis bryophila TaxID=655015 RepID=A0A1W6MTS7_9HYPH|nr:hypothetical protein [Methylocystis bryophila]ARN81023.1 hypothetical protein B1812_07985 [Methylocystis bryophila]BDV36941.1 hypothetical protein DSM21852_01940 [Methylocystis bryophila]